MEAYGVPREIDSYVMFAAWFEGRPFGDWGAGIFIRFIFLVRGPIGGQQALDSSDQIAESCLRGWAGSFWPVADKLHSHFVGRGLCGSLDHAFLGPFQFYDGIRYLAVRFGRTDIGERIHPKVQPHCSIRLFYGLQLEGAVADVRPIVRRIFTIRGPGARKMVAIRRANLEAPRGLETLQSVENAAVRVLAVLLRYLGVAHVHRNVVCPTPHLADEFHSVGGEFRTACLVCPVRSEVSYGCVEYVLQILARLVCALRKRRNRKKTEAQYGNRVNGCLAQSHSPWRKVDRNPVALGAEEGVSRRWKCVPPPYHCQPAKFAWRGTSEKVLRPQLSKRNHFLGGFLLSEGDSLSGSSTCQMSLSLCKPKTPTWFDSEVPICPIQTTLKRALRQWRRTSMEIG